MKSNLMMFVLLLMVNMSSWGQDLYVSTSGSASNSGTSITSPTTLENAVATVAAGSTIYMRGGTYNFSATIFIMRPNDGKPGALKSVVAYNGEVPILDFSAQTLATGSRGIVLDGSYWYFKEIIVQGAGDNGILVAGNNNTFNNCVFRKNRDTGLQLSRYNTSFTSVSQWPANNLILNCEAYDNKDATAENADGFAAKLTCGNGNIFRGCIAHNNSDDGWDFYAKTATGPIGIVTLENCIAYNNGTLTDGTTSSNGDKNGFKLGGSGIPTNHIVRRCIAFGNGQHGFTDNNNPGAIEVSNNTSWNNKQSNFNFRDGSTSVLRNNLSLSGGSSDKTFGTDVSNSNVWWKNNVSTNAGGLVVSAADFVSLTVPSSLKNADGSPNIGNFLSLAAGSDMINSGVNAPGISFNGSAPDLGAVESGGTTPPPPPPTTYSLTTATAPAAGGTVTRSPNASSYAAGTVVTLTATAAAGYTFTGWSGAASGTSATTTVTINANTTVTANFTTSTTTTYTLATAAAPAAGGTITRSPNASSYAAGTVVTLTATAAAGYTFTGWSGAASGTSATTTVTINANTTVTANFTTSTTTTFALTTTAAPAAGGTITRSPNASSYAAGTVVTLTATAAAGYTFTGWSGAASGTAATTTVTINAATAVTANFTATTGGTGTTLRIDDKSGTGVGYCSAEGSRQSSYSGADGGYYVNLSNASAKGIVWAVKAAAAGTYSLKWRYANAGSSSATTAKVLVNGTQAIASVAFPKTSTWTAWTTTASVTVTLVAGTNKIRLETITADEFANIDWIEITGNNPTQVACSSVIGSIIADAANAIEGGENRVIVSNLTINKQSVVRFTSANKQRVVITLFSADGRTVKNIANATYAAGTNNVTINCSNLKPATYFVVINADGHKTTKHLVVQ